MKRVTACILSLLFTLLFTNQSFALDSVQAITAALKKHSLPIQSIESTYNFSDLQPFKSILNEVNVIGLGEATHGTREFYQMKHRLLRFLVQEMNFDALLKNFETRELKGFYDGIIYIERSTPAQPTKNAIERSVNKIEF